VISNLLQIERNNPHIPEIYNKVYVVRIINQKKKTKEKKNDSLFFRISLKLLTELIMELINMKQTFHQNILIIQI